MSRNDSPLPGGDVELQDIAIGHSGGAAALTPSRDGAVAGAPSGVGSDGGTALVTGGAVDGGSRTLAGRVRRACSVVGPPWVKNIVLCETCER